MRFYQPIEGLLGPRRRRRRSRATFGLLVALGGGVALYWALLAGDSPAEARTDRILSLSAPDFTDVLGETEPAETGVETLPGATARRLRRPSQVDGVMARNQTLFVAMRDAGAESGSIQQVVASLQGAFDFRRARPGDEWEARLDEEGRIERFRYDVSPEEVYEAVRRSDGRYEAGRLDIPTEVIVVGLGGTVLTSIYDAMTELGEGTGLASRLMEAFRWDFDFSRDARPGDRFRVIVEKVLLDGTFLRYGRVLAVEFAGASGTLQAYALTDESGHTEYYTADGEPLRRRYLTAPLTYRRISSEFTRRRFHPVLRRYRPHLGVDYAADTGTPIWALADGRVTYANYRGASGNLVVIQHDDTVETVYAHLSRFAEGLERGDEVAQGEVIGFVGTTGRSTGPHLHFGTRVDGEPVDPASLQAQRGEPLEGEALAQLRAEVERLNEALEAIVIAPVDLSAIPARDVETLDELPGDFGILDDDGDDEELQDDP